jgi:hypothetical protein
MAEDGSAPAYVTALGETDSENDACHHCCAADRGHAVINRNW